MSMLWRCSNEPLCPLVFFNYRQMCFFHRRSWQKINGQMLTLLHCLANLYKEGKNLSSDAVNWEVTNQFNTTISTTKFLIYCYILYILYFLLAILLRCFLVPKLKLFSSECSPVCLSNFCLKFSCCCLMSILRPKEKNWKPSPQQNTAERKFNET